MQQGLLIVDVQNDYFPGGAMELVGMEKLLNILLLFKRISWR